MVVGEFEVEDGCGFVFGPTLRVRLRLTLKGNVGLRANPYSYVRNNPLNYTDPSGMDPIGLFKGSGFPRGGIGKPGIRNFAGPEGGTEGGGKSVPFGKLFPVAASRGPEAAFNYLVGKGMIIHDMGPLILGPNLGPSRHDPFDLWMKMANQAAVINDANRRQLMIEGNLHYLMQDAIDYANNHPEATEAEIQDWVKQAARATGIPEQVALSVLYTENRIGIDDIKKGEDANKVNLMQIEDGPGMAGTGEYFGLNLADESAVPWRTNWGANIVAGMAYYAHLYYDYAITRYGFEPGSRQAYQSAYSMYNGGPKAWYRFLFMMDKRDQNFQNELNYWGF